MKKAMIKQMLPTALTIVGAVGVVATGILAARAAIKADREITRAEFDRLQDETPPVEGNNGSEAAKTTGYSTLSRIDKVKVSWKCFVLPVAVGAATITSVVMANRLSAKEIAALTAACGCLAANRDKLEEIINNEFGGHDILNSVKHDVYDEMSVPTYAEPTGNGDLLCYEAYSGRLFRSSREAVDEAMQKWDELWEAGNSLCFNDLYELLDIEDTRFGWEHGYPNDPDWYDGPIMSSVYYVDKFGKFDETAYIIDIWTPPIEGWYEI